MVVSKRLHMDVSKHLLLIVSKRKVYSHQISGDDKMNYCIEFLLGGEDLSYMLFHALTLLFADGIIDAA